MLKNKWKNIKASARRRDKLIKKSQLQTGGGRLTIPEKRIVESPLYLDIANKLGVSASGNVPRFDSDSASGSQIEPPTSRLRQIMSTNLNESIDSVVNDEDTRMSTGSNMTTADIGNALNATFQENSSDDLNQSSSLPELPSLNQSSSSSQFSRIASTPSTSTPSTSKNSGASTTVQSKKKKTGDVQKDTSTQLSEHLTQQQENNLLHNQYLTLQIERSQIAKEREILEKQLVEMEVQKKEQLMNIEIGKQRRLAELEVEAKRREYNL